MNLRSKIIAAAALLLLTGGATYAQSAMTCCEDCECWQQMMAAREGAAEAETPAHHAGHEGM